MANVTDLKPTILITPYGNNFHASVVTQKNTVLYTADYVINHYFNGVDLRKIATPTGVM
jgi:hypothetical protein